MRGVPAGDSAKARVVMERRAVSVIVMRPMVSVVVCCAADWLIPSAMVDCSRWFGVEHTKVQGSGYYGKGLQRGQWRIL